MSEDKNIEELKKAMEAKDRVEQDILTHIEELQKKYRIELKRKFVFDIAGVSDINEFKKQYGRDAKTEFNQILSYASDEVKKSFNELSKKSATEEVVKTKYVESIIKAINDNFAEIELYPIKGSDGSITVGFKNKEQPQQNNRKNNDKDFEHATTNNDIEKEIQDLFKDLMSRSIQATNGFVKQITIDTNRQIAINVILEKYGRKVVYGEHGVYKARKTPVVEKIQGPISKEMDKVIKNQKVTKKDVSTFKEVISRGNESWRESSINENTTPFVHSLIEKAKRISNKEEFSDSRKIKDREFLQNVIEEIEYMGARVKYADIPIITDHIKETEKALKQILQLINRDDEYEHSLADFLAKRDFVTVLSKEDILSKFPLLPPLDQKQIIKDLFNAKKQLRDLREKQLSSMPKKIRKLIEKDYNKNFKLFKDMYTKFDGTKPFEDEIVKMKPELSLTVYTDGNDRTIFEYNDMGEVIKDNLEQNITSGPLSDLWREPVSQKVQQMPFEKQKVFNNLLGTFGDFGLIKRNQDENGNTTLSGELSYLRQREFNYTVEYETTDKNGNKVTRVRPATKDDDPRKFIVHGGQIKTEEDEVARLIFDIFSIAFEQNQPELQRFLQNLPEKENAAIKKEDLDKRFSGNYIGYKDENKFYKLKHPETEKEIALAQRAKNYKDYFLTPLLQNEIGTTLEDDLKEELRIAEKKFKRLTTELEARTDMELRLKMPKLDTSKITRLAVQNAQKKILQLARPPRTQKKVSANSGAQIRGPMNIFFKNESQRKKYSQPIPYKSKLKESQQLLSSYTLDIKYPELKTPDDSNIVIIRKSGLKPYPIPESVLKIAALKKMWGAERAALFFQLLISNTPVDERYRYKEVVLTKRNRGNAELYEDEPYKEEVTEKGVDGNLTTYTKKTTVKIVRYGEDIAADWLKNGEVVTKTRDRIHIPDSIRVRDFWEFTYKGVTFRPTDSDFEGDQYFMKPGDVDSVNAIFHIFLERTKNSKVKNVNFSYKNTHPRWEQLEYGGYKKDSGPWQGMDHFNRKHGVKGGFVYQAPHGWIRLIESQWNDFQATGKDSEIIAQAINIDGFNAAEVRDETIAMLKKYESTLGTREYDYNNFVIIEGV